MQRLLRILRRKTFARRFCAGAFLLFLFCEVGSHSFLIGHHEHDDLPVTSTTELADSGHGDHDCESAAFCEEDSPQDHQLPNLQDQVSHHDVVVSNHYVRFIRDSRDTVRFAFVDVDTQYRSPAPPYFPPKHS